MATLTTLWLMPIMMTGWCFSCKVCARPPRPDCHIPLDDNQDIVCTWDPPPGLNINLTYSLHWESNKSSKATGHRAIIQRYEFAIHSELQVWVQSKDQDGTVSKSETVTFNTADIFKPSSPKIKSSSEDPIEIHWNSPCDQWMLEVGRCDVRYRTEAQPAWVQKEEDGVSGSYTLSTPEPFTKYLFQVRCKCHITKMSEWSEVHTIRSKEKAPLGMLDIWRDCGVLNKTSECVLTWKKLPMSKARGHISGYNMSLFFNNGSYRTLNVSTALSHLVCDEVQCHYKWPLKGVNVHVDAYNGAGVTETSHLDLQVPEKIPKEEAVNLEMNENNLTVSWDVKSWIPDLKEYVVQYKEAGSSLGQGFDWIRLNANVTKVIIKGRFKNFTAYQVSVFTVSHHNKVHLYCTSITHFVQGVPAKVPLFEVISYGTTYVKLLWEPILMSVQNGVTPYYQIGYGKDSVYTVSAYPQLENRTYTLDNLVENHNYEVWIKAVNQAGAGPNVTVLFQTLPPENYGAVLIGVFGVVGLSVLILIALYCCRENKACPAIISSLYEKVPDPHNSKIIREMTCQIHDSLAWLCAPYVEQCPKISDIEIVKTSSPAFSPRSVRHINNEDGDDPLEDIHTQEDKRTQCGCGKQEYSKMIDSDEEKNQDDETGKSSWSSEEDYSGYEQHFMPKSSDLLEIEQGCQTHLGPRATFDII